jgi:hypothetical protein
MKVTGGLYEFLCDSKKQDKACSNRPDVPGMVFPEKEELG